MADGIQEALEKLKSQREEASSEEDKQDGDVVDVSEDTPEEAEEPAEIVAEIEESDEEVEEVDDVQDDDVDEGLDTLVFEIEGKEYTQEAITEALEGNMRLADYTRKTQAVAEDRKSVESDREKLTGKMTELQSHIDLFAEATDTEFKDIDWEQLRELDTPEYLRLKEKQAGKQDRLAKARSDMKALEDEQYEALVVTESGKMFDVMGWKDNPKQQKDDSALISTYLAQAKWTNAEFSEIVNHKHMLVMLDAAKYHALKSKAPATKKKVKRAPKVIKGRKASVTGIDRQIIDAQAKLKKSGKIADAQALRKLQRQLNQ